MRIVIHFIGVILLNCSTTQMLAHLDPLHMHAVSATLTKYRRQFTLLEIGRGSCRYLEELPRQSNMIGLGILLAGDPESLTKHLQKTHVKFSVMAPPRLTIQMLERLARCEHFDVVVVHDGRSLVNTEPSRLIAALMSLGDHIYLEADTEAYEKQLRRSTRITQLVKRTPDRSSLFVLHTKKKGLDLARYTQKKSRSSSLRYEVLSSYSAKQFYKNGLLEPIKWIQGINLVTFIMFHGVYPTSKHIEKELLRIRSTYSHHNDLVLGNLIVQGTRLIPIDFYDERRAARSDDCIEVALKAFKEDKSRQKYPERWIARYYKEIACA